MNVIENNGTDVIIESISDAQVMEGDNVVHHVVLSSTTTKSILLNLSIENMTTSDSDYNHELKFSESAFTYFNSILIVPENIKEFDILVPTFYDQEIERDETYKIHLNDKSAIGTILDLPV